MPMSIYPPILPTSQPAFTPANKYTIYFNLNSLTDWDSVKHVQLRIMKQTNNKSIINTSTYPDGTIYRDAVNIMFNADVKAYEFQVFSSDLQEMWQPGYLYKIQIRLGSNMTWLATGDKFATWKKRQVDESAFSEWSTVMLVKVIDEPTVIISNSKVQDPNTSAQATELSLTPIFYGQYNIDSGNNEAEDVYKFTLYAGTNDSNEIATSGWCQHNQYQNAPDQYRFNLILEDSRLYTVRYEIRTINGYEKSAALYTFTAVKEMLDSISHVTFEAEDDSIFCHENACIRIKLTTDKDFSMIGSYVIIRASENDNFTIWEDIKFLTYAYEEFSEPEVVFDDFSIESGIKYKYAIQSVNSEGLRTNPLTEQNSPTRCVDFEYAYLSRDGVQLKLSFNNQMSSFKHTVLQSKQDTLGGKYPYLARNGNAYYAEFPITGLISFSMDEDQTFFTMRDDGAYFKDELVIPIDKFSKETQYVNQNIKLGTIDRNLTYDNIFIERKFREKVEQFLNSFDYKLYRSATEGNIVIALSNVSLSPNQTLGRMIYSFSATAYEVLDNTIENLNDYGIINIGVQQKVNAVYQTNISFGQLNGYFEGQQNPLSLSQTRAVISSAQNLTKLIDEQQRKAANGYKNVVKKINSISIEQYPRINTTARRLELEAERIDKLIEDAPLEEIEAIDEEIAALDKLEYSLSHTADLTNIVLIIDGVEILMRTGKPYVLKNLSAELPTIQLKYSGPVILNYVCEITQEEDNSKGIITSVGHSRVWGQISGIFTDTDAILRDYDYLYHLSETYRIYNPYPEGIIVDRDGHVIVDNTQINLYKSKNIYNIIVEEAKQQVESMDDYRPYGKANNYDEKELEWYNKQFRFKVDDITSIDIEADTGTILYIGSKPDGSDKIEIAIGPTGRYVLNPAENMISYLAFKNPVYAVINYKCYTTQKIMKTEG